MKYVLVGGKRKEIIPESLRLVQNVSFTASPSFTHFETSIVLNGDIQMKPSSVKPVVATISPCVECAGRDSHADVLLRGLAERSSMRCAIVSTMYAAVYCTSITSIPR